jgi:hypothetical protein
VGRFGGGRAQVFRLSPNPKGPKWLWTVLYRACSATPCTDGEEPISGLTMDTSGNLYGTAYYGGSAAACPDSEGCGIVFRLTYNATGTPWQQSVFHNFCSAKDCAEGADPVGGIVLDAARNIYGTTQLGGSLTPCGGSPTGCGVVYQLTRDGSGPLFAEVRLHSFCQQRNCADGAVPISALVMDQSGNLYGISPEGGTGAYCPTSLGCGVVFELVK